MDKLSESKRAEVKKMSDARLMSKLMQAGYSADQVEAMNREVLMSTWAEIVVTGKEVASATALFSSERCHFMDRHSLNRHNFLYHI